MKKITALLALLIPLFTSGCFTAVRQYGEGWNGESSKADKAKTTALDVATSPIQAPVVAPLFLAAAVKRSNADRKAKQDADADKKLMPLLESDPTLGFKERWDRKSKQHCRVFANSFSNPNVKYTDSILEDIYQNCTNVSCYVFCSKSCTPEFLAKHYDEESEKDKGMAIRKGRENIVSNPNTPFELVYKASTIGVSGANGAITNRTQEAKPFLMALLENDPKVALVDKWERKLVHRIVFVESFSNPKVKYNDALLEEIRQKCPMLGNYVFRCQYCSSSFLVKHFDEQYALSSKWSYDRQPGLEDIIANANTPIELVEKVATSHDFDNVKGNNGNTARLAQSILAKRRSEH